MLRDRLIARWRAAELDRALAGGAPPDANAPLALRARDLTGVAERRRLARRLRRIVREAFRPVTSFEFRVPVCRAEVREVADDLDVLARRLVAPAPVSPRGVAQVRLLLTDGAGPLYWRCAAGDLGAAVEAAIERLEPPDQAPRKTWR